MTIWHDGPADDDPRADFHALYWLGGWVVIAVLLALACVGAR